MIGVRRLILALVTVMGLLAVEGLYVWKGGEPSVECFLAIAGIPGAFYAADYGVKRARAKAGITDAEGVEQERSAK